METLIRAVEGPGSYTMHGVNIDSLTHADDLCIVADGKEQMQQRLDRLHTAAVWAGLVFNAKKMCHINSVQISSAIC